MEKMLRKAVKRRTMRLRCSFQNYEWGRVGKQSEVGRLYSLQWKVEVEEKPYAELWVGTHESGPSYVLLDDSGNSTMLLKDWLSENPEVLGEKVVERWGSDLPFLFKVLSVGKALSIQAHPDKKLAERLHNLQPNIYKDDNHKPEMALALTDFEALCGFVSPQELKQAIETVPEFRFVLGEVDALLNISHFQVGGERLKDELRTAFTTIMTACSTVVANAVSKLLSRLETEEKVRALTSKELIVRRLAKQYPGDVGVLSVFFFNHITLAPGEALYLDANEPHAYLSGECIECMATSDNVVRAGLTPKFRDIETLCSMLTYKQDPPKVLCGVPLNSYTKRYSSPFDEFEVDCSIIPCGHRVKFPALSGPSIILILCGAGVMSEVYKNEKFVTVLQRGEVFFVPAGIQLDLVASIEVHLTGQKDNPLHIYRAGVSTRVLEGKIK